MKYRILILSCIVLGALAACLPEPTLRNENFLADTSILQVEPCEAPCWRDIVPGETTWREAKIILEDDTQLSVVDDIQDEETTARLITFKGAEGDECCRLYSEDGNIVDTIAMYVQPETTLGQVIDRWGDPTYLVAEDVAANQALASLFYPEVPMVIQVFAAGVTDGELVESSEVIGWIYTHDTIMDEILTNVNFYEWDTYGPLSSYLNGDFDITAVPTVEAAATLGADLQDDTIEPGSSTTGD